MTLLSFPLRFGGLLSRLLCNVAHFLTGTSHLLNRTGDRLNEVGLLLMTFRVGQCDGIYLLGLLFEGFCLLLDFCNHRLCRLDKPVECRGHLAEFVFSFNRDPLAQIAIALGDVLDVISLQLQRVVAITTPIKFAESCIFILFRYIMRFDVVI